MRVTAMCLGLHQSARVEVTVDKLAYVDREFFTKNDSQNKTLQYDTTYAERPVYCAQISIIEVSDRLKPESK